MNPVTLQGVKVNSLNWFNSYTFCEKDTSPFWPSSVGYIYHIYSNPEARTYLNVHFWFPTTAVQTCCYFLPQTWMCALRDSNIPHSPPFFPSSTFMDSAFLFSASFSPGLGQRDGCCVMSVIVLILPFSQYFNLFMLLPNLYWVIICILYMIMFPLPVVTQLWGLYFHATLCNVVDGNL